MFKKVNSFTIVLAVMILVLSACSSKDAGSASSAAPAANQTAAPINNGPVTIAWWDSMTSEGSQTALKKIIADYEKAHANVKIERTFVKFSDIKNKLLLGSAGNQLPDIVWMDNPDHQAFAAAGILADLTKEIQAWGQGDKYFKGPWASTVYKGKNYGVPIGSNNLALYYNSDMLTAAGITPPKTWDELKAAAKKLTKPDVYGFSLSAVKSEEGTFQFLPFMYQAGSDVPDFNTPGTVKAATLYKEMIDGGYMSKEVITQKQSDIVALFAVGKSAMMVNGTWQIPYLQKNATVKWDVVVLPADKDSATVFGGENWAITEASKHKDVAFDIIKFANEPENLKAFLQVSGRVPAREDYIMDPFWQDDKQMKIFADGMKVAKARAFGPNYPKISEAIQIMLQEVVTGVKSPEVAVKDANSIIKPLLP